MQAWLRRLDRGGAECVSRLTVLPPCAQLRDIHYDRDTSIVTFKAIQQHTTHLFLEQLCVCLLYKIKNVHKIHWLLCVLSETRRHRTNHHIRWSPVGEKTALWILGFDAKLCNFSTLILLEQNKAVTDECVMRVCGIWHKRQVNPKVVCVVWGDRRFTATCR